jgi:LysM repeat protein
VRRILTGLGALAVLGLLLVGLPTLLWVIGPVGLPHVEPTLAGLWRALLTPDDGTVFLTLVKVAGWVVWALLLITVTTEAISRLRHLHAPRLPGLALPQGVARGLVASALTLFINTNTAVSAPLPAHTLVAAAAPANPTQPLEVPGAAPATGPRYERYTVKKGDILSKLALDHLGDAHRYPEIYKASRDIHQPGGARLTDPDVIDIGWKLNIPTDQGDKTTRESRRKPDQPEPSAQTPASTTPTPSLTPSPVVEPSQTSAPTAVAPPAEADETDTVADYQPGWLLTGLSGAGAILAGCLWLVLHRRRALQHHHRRPGLVTAPPPPATTPVEKTLRHQGQPIADLVTFVDETLRRLTATILTRGDRLPPLVAVEVARSTLTVHLAADTQLPEPWQPGEGSRSWTISTADEPDTIGPLEPDGPAPWPHLTTVGADDTGHWWLLNLEHLGTLSITGDHDYADDLARYLAAELTTNPWSRDLEIDLIDVFPEIVGLGPSRCHHHPDRAGLDEVLTAAVDMADRVNSTKVADAPTGRVQYPDDELWTSHLLVTRADAPGQLDDLVHLIDTMPLRTATVVLALDSDGNPPIGVELLASPNGRVRIPSLGLDLIGNGITLDEARGCVQLLQAADELGGATVPPLQAAPGEPWRDLADSSGRLRDDLTAPRDPNGRPDSGSNVPEPDHVVTTAAATKPEDLALLAPDIPPTTSAAVELADPTLDADLEAWFAPTSHRPRLAVLGPMKLRVAPGQENEDTARRRPYYTELIAYLATRRHGATTDELCAAFDTNPGRVRRDLATVRKWLGTDPTTGEHYLPAATQKPADNGRTTGHYELTGLLYDADLFRRLRLRGQTRGPAGIDDFMNALRLVCGPPYHGIRERGGIWLTDHRDDQHLLVAIVDTAHLAAAMAMQTGDHGAARRAAETAMRAAPDEDVPKVDLAAAIAADGKVRESVELTRAVKTQRDTDGPLNLDRRTTELLRVHGRAVPESRTN